MNKRVLSVVCGLTVVACMPALLAWGRGSSPYQGKRSAPPAEPVIEKKAPPVIRQMPVADAAPIVVHKEHPLPPPEHKVRVVQHRSQPKHEMKHEEHACNGVMLEVRTSYFYPTSHKFRSIFGDGNVNYQLNTTFPVYYGKNVWVQGIDIWFAVDYFHKNGHTKPLHDRTSISIVPITIGLKYFFPALGKVAPVNFYLGSGLKYFFVHTHDNNPYVKRILNVNGAGGVFETGFTTTFVKHLVLDVFASYSIKKFDAPSVHNAAVKAKSFDVSNVNVGLGLGYKF